MPVDLSKQHEVAAVSTPGILPDFTAMRWQSRAKDEH